jgi:hypothetical protein
MELDAQDLKIEAHEMKMDVCEAWAFPQNLGWGPFTTTPLVSSWDENENAELNAESRTPYP